MKNQIILNKNIKKVSSIYLCIDQKIIILIKVAVFVEKKGLVIIEYIVS